MQSNTNSTIYVGDLSDSVTERDLFLIFRKIAPVASVTCCYGFNNSFKNYAYISYFDRIHAESAISLLNTTKIRGVTCRIMWRDVNILQNINRKANVYVKNINKSVQTKELYDLFVGVGDIISCKIENKKNRSAFYGFVQFKEESSCELAIQKFDNIELRGRKLKLSVFTGRDNEVENVEGRYIYEMSNISCNITYMQLKQKLEEYGECKIDQRNESLSTKSVYVRFNDSNDACLCRNTIDNTDVFGDAHMIRFFCVDNEKNIDNVCATLTKEKRMHYKQNVISENIHNGEFWNLYVGNISTDLDNRMLYELFERYDNITIAQVMRRKTKEGLYESRGFGFVLFSSFDSATKAICELNGAYVAGGIITVAFYKPKYNQFKSDLYIPQIDNSITQLPPQPSTQFQNEYYNTITYNMYLYYMQYNSFMYNYNYQLQLQAYNDSTCTIPSDTVSIMKPLFLMTSGEISTFLSNKTTHQANQILGECLFNQLRSEVEFENIVELVKRILYKYNMHKILFFTSKKEALLGAVRKLCVL